MMDLMFLEAYKECLEKDYIKQLIISIILCLLMIIFAYADNPFFGGATVSILVISCIKLHGTVKELEAVERDLKMPVEVIRSINHEKD